MIKRRETEDERKKRVRKREAGHQPEVIYYTSEDIHIHPLPLLHLFSSPLLSPLLSPLHVYPHGPLSSSLLCTSLFLTFPCIFLLSPNVFSPLSLLLC